MLVPDLSTFHRANFELNKHHYTVAARISRLKTVLAAQKYGAMAHFNSVKHPEGRLKYWVVETDTAIKDL